MKQRGCRQLVDLTRNATRAFMNQLFRQIIEQIRGASVDGAYLQRVPRDPISDDRGILNLGFT